MIKIIKKRINKTYQCIKCFILNTFSNKYILVRASLKIKNNKIVWQNWGDDVNYYLISMISNKKVLFVPDSRLSYFLPMKSYLGIGSIITFFSLRKVIIWGSGIINPNETKKIKGVPCKILAVRGPKTREELIKHNINCPEVYGDPALLFPLLYKPNEVKKYKLGIIPHTTDKNNNNIKRLLCDDRTLFIDVTNSSNWRGFINSINQCEFIISSSLHGLIIAEAYGIPSKWVLFSDKTDGWNFKFEDFYESISKQNEKPLFINDKITVDELYEYKDKWKKGNIDIKKLIKVCPYNNCEALMNYINE